jgi:parvulin-like peptidyl-prolyl isomerase
MRTHRPWLVALLLAMIIVAMALPAGAARAYDHVVAKLDDDIILASDLADVLREKRGLVAVDDPGAAADTDSVRALLDRSLLLGVAKRSGVEPPDAEIHEQVEAMLQEVQSHYPSKDEFSKDIAEQYGSIEKFRQELARRATTDYRIGRAIANRFTLTDTDVAAFEAECRQKGVLPESYHLRRIGVVVDPAKGSGRAAALARVAGLLEKANQEGLSFVEAARRYSQIPGEAELGGDLGYIAADKLTPDVRRAVEKLEPGQVTPPLITGNFACIFYMESKRGARSALFEKRFVEQREALLKELRRKASLTIYDKRLLGKVPPEYAACLRIPLSSEATTSATRETSSPAQAGSTPRSRGGFFGRILPARSR